MTALDDLMPPVQFADTNGVRMAYYEVGPRRGIPVIFCHGFPELAFSWRHQLRAFEAAGIWAIAPDQRGYGLTKGPAEVEGYDLAHLMGDLVGLMDHLEIDKAIFCGHDWGGIVVWQMPLYHPSRVAGVIGLNTPFIPRAPADPIEIMRRRFGEEMYIVQFQRSGEADAILGADAAKTMNMFLRRPLASDGPASGGLAGGALGEGEANTGVSSFALVNALKDYDPAVDPREHFLSPQEMTVFADTFTRTGFTGGINWYRNFTRNWDAAEGVPEKVLVPSLMIMAEKDAVLPPAAADGMEVYVADLEKVLIKGSGHWTQQEKPDEVNRVLMDWLARRFIG